MRSYPFDRVFNARGHRVRGLWIRNGIYYAVLRLPSHKSPVKIRLKTAQTVAQATAALQALKVKRSAGGLEVVKTRAVPRFADVADDYLAELSQLGTKKPKTVACEKSNITKLKQFLGAKPITSLSMKDAYAFARWRRSEKRKPGRAVDVTIRTLRHVLAKAVRDGHLSVNPVGRWSALAPTPAKKRLVTNEEIQKIRSAGNQDFSDYLELLRLSGGREQETLALKWSVSVDFGRRLLGFGQGDLARFSKNSDSRWLPCSVDLYNHLWCMWLKSGNSDWLFPNRWDASKRTKSFKNSLKSAKKKAKVAEFGFHHLRHSFISNCVMSGIDYLTIAQLVGHRDGGVLIGKIYGHLNPEHFRSEATKIKFL